tara:strand:+ start:78 stop:758 length:681 start_codon:yes stop_codon:yes gene_type:complete
MSIPFWLNKPAILLDRDHITEFWCNKDMTSSQKLNAVTRLVIVLTVLGYFMTQNINFLIMGFITLGIIIALYYHFATRSRVNKPKKNIREGFTNPKEFKALENNFTKPTMKNPLMNVSLPEIGDDPQRKSAAPAFNPAVEKEINSSTKRQIRAMHRDQPDIDEKLFKDLGDNFNFEQSMRPFYATANTQIPNDQKSFAEFCYGNMPSCKEGNAFACMQNNERYIKI